MTNADAFPLLIALVIPFLVGLLTKGTFPSWLRYAFVVVFSGLVGAGTLYFSGALVFTWDNFLVTTLAIIGASQTVYQALIEPTGLKAWLDGTLVK